MAKSTKRNRSNLGKKKSKLSRTNKRSTRKSQFSVGNLPNNQKSHLVRVFLEMINVVKLYHWKTRSYAQHKATDELHASLNSHIDKFVEILLGKDQSRIHMVEKRIDLLDAHNTNEFKKRVFEYREFLISLNIYFDSSRDSDLLNVRDEILGDLNQFLYLMSFDK